MTEDKCLDGITDSMDMSLRRTGKPNILRSMGSQRIRHNLATEQQTENKEEA